MQPIVLTGSSVEKILREFCKEKKIEETDISYEVIEEGKSGFLGFIGSKKASIKVNSFGEKKTILEFIEKLLEKMNIDYIDIEVSETKDSFNYHIVGSTEAGFLIGKEARFLNNLQYLVNRIFEKEKGKRVYIDVDDYKKRQAESVIRKYEPIFDKVISNQKPYTLDPLDPSIRRILHQYIDDKGNLSTLTIGDGKRKRIVVFPKGYDQSKIRKRSYVPPRKKGPANPNNKNNGENHRADQDNRKAKQNNRRNQQDSRKANNDNRKANNENRKANNDNRKGVSEGNKPNRNYKPRPKNTTYKRKNYNNSNRPKKKPNTEIEFD
jgi:spoIIIJ-associated protein